MCGPVVASRATRARANRSLAMELRHRGLEALQLRLDPGPAGGRHPARDPFHAGLGELLECLGVGRNAHHPHRDAALARLRDALEHVATREVGEPEVAERGRAVDHSGAVATHQYRWVWPLRRLRPRPDAVEVHEAPAVARLVLCPDRLHGLDALGEQLHPRARIGAVVGHLLAVPAGADPELQPPARQVVDRGDLLGGHDRVALDDEADAGPDPRPRRRLGGRGHGHEQVVGVGVLARELAAPRIGRLPRRRDVRVLGEVDGVVPVLLDELRHVAWPHRVVGREVADAGVHTAMPTRVAQCATVLTDYHVHLRPDEPDTPPREYFTPANAERYREAAAERGIAELGVAEHIHRFTAAL